MYILSNSQMLIFLGGKVHNSQWLIDTWKILTFFEWWQVHMVYASAIPVKVHLPGR